MPDYAPAGSAAGSNANIARHLGTMAVDHPQGVALKVPRGRNRAGEIDYLALTFAELDAEVAAWCVRLARAGLRPGDRTLVMVRQGLPLIASVFAIFRLGAVPVVIDPGMGLKSFLACVARSQPRALVGIPFAQLVSHVARSAFRSVRIRVSARNTLTARLTSGLFGTAPQVRPALNAPTDLAAVLFTSGSTGSPKGVCYEHGMFDAQVRLIRATYAIEPGEIDLPLLPIFALFNPALGMTTIVPEIDPRKPAALDPAKIVQAIRQERVTNSFGSPTLWRKIAQHCRDQNVTLPSLRRVLCAGAAVPASLWENARVFLPNGRLHSPYGATEALPVTSVSAADIEPDSIRGACVGRPVAEMEIKIVAVTDGAIATLMDARILRPGEIGEIIVRGPVVTKTYDWQPDATALAKIRGESGIWHRMGDCGYFDADGRLWFCGRKVERVETTTGTLYTEPCEQVFRRHPRAARCALIGLGPRGRQRPAIVVETKLKDDADGRAFAHELRTLALAHAHTSGIAHFYFRAAFPVDVRHNAKIHRLTLAQWAETAVGFESESK
ncbi:fatty acid CoA ligase family protein [Horticoccus sp. 23ND18S-11]|uniref:fatty acid CoA ligase family protein n=1 Tax=Horticoccus sp. 23ND18S-11 TaxID=3391832 RepID=UPI0039C9FAE0